MQTTHLKAKQMLIDGAGIDAAWEVAQQDEGLLPNITKQDWVRYMSKIIAAEVQPDLDQYYANYY